LTYGLGEAAIAPQAWRSMCRLRRLVEASGVKYDKAVECLIKDRDALLAFYDFPAEHWKHCARRTSSKARSPRCATAPYAPKDAAPTTSLGGLRAKALVALWEALPASAFHHGAFEFRDDGEASRSLFEAVAGTTGLLPMLRELEARLEADAERKDDDG
jgi:hypothetical protein